MLGKTVVGGDGDIGDEILPSYVGIISQAILRIPFNQLESEMMMMTMTMMMMMMMTAIFMFWITVIQ